MIKWHQCTYRKVQLFWEGHKNLLNRPYGFEIYLVNVKTTRNIAQIFVAFSEKLNFSVWVELSSLWEFKADQNIAVVLY